MDICDVGMVSRPGVCGLDSSFFIPEPKGICACLRLQPQERIPYPFHSPSVCASSEASVLMLTVAENRVTNYDELLAARAEIISKL